MIKTGFWFLLGAIWLSPFGNFSPSQLAEPTALPGLLGQTAGAVVSLAGPLPNSRIQPSDFDNLNEKSLSICRYKVGDFELEVHTELEVDSLDESQVIAARYSSPVVKKQTLRFFKNGSLLSEFTPGLRMVNKVNTRNETISVVEAPIWKISVYEGNGKVFVVHGAGLCTGASCPEYAGIFSMEGKDLYQGYSTTDTLFESYPSWSEVLLEFEISDAAFRTGEANSLRVDTWWDQ